MTPAWVRAEASWTLHVIKLMVLGSADLPLLLPRSVLGRNRQAGVILCDDALGRRWCALGSAGYVAAIASHPRAVWPTTVEFKPYVMTHLIRGWPDDWKTMQFHETRARRVISDNPKRSK